MKGFPREEKGENCPLLSPRKQTEPQVAGVAFSYSPGVGKFEFQLGLMAPDRSCRPSLQETEMLINERGKDSQF